MFPFGLVTWYVAYYILMESLKRNLHSCAGAMCVACICVTYFLFYATTDLTPGTGRLSNI
jgi:hypothetical protein